MKAKRHIPFSRITGKWTIGKKFVTQQDISIHRKYKGLVDSFQDYESQAFRVSCLHPSIIDFYEHTDCYELKAYIKWAMWFRPFAFIYRLFSYFIQQIHLSKGNRWERMYGEIVGIDSEKDGRDNIRAWIRENEAGRTIFVALYSSHRTNGETYMNIALPLPFSNMTGILRAENQGENLILTSVQREEGNGDEGIYLHSKRFTAPLPLAEKFYITVDKSTIRAHHNMWIFGLSFLQIDYLISKEKSLSDFNK